jgi:hypothetical protein
LALRRSLRGRLALWFGALVSGCVMAAFCLSGSRSLVVSRGSSAPWAAPWWRRVAGFALAAGACRWRVRGSARSFSGAVVVAGFASLAGARAFAAAWGGWCGVGCVVRRRVCPRWGVVWAVSVPVLWGAR